MSSTPVTSPEDNHQVYDVAESEQWSREPMPVENGTPQEWSDAPPPLGIPGPSSNGINPGYYNNGLSFNGNGIIPIPGNSVNIPFERNVNGMYTMNGVRPPHNVITPGMCRPNGFAPNALNGNGYVNAVANGRFIRAPGWVTTNKVSNGVKKQKRNRTAFTSQQMMELEQEYARTRYLDRNRRIELSETLNLNQRTIKIWFQNRRMKEKKDRAESLEECESEEVSTTESSPDLTSDIPTFIDQYPVMVTSNDMLNRGGLYMEHYPVSTIPSAIMTPALPRTIASAMPSSLTSPLPSSVPSTLPAALPPVQNQMPNDFMEYVPEVYDPQCKQVHLQMQHYNTPFDGTLQEVPHESVSSEASPPSAPTSMTNQSWDLSWIRSIHAEEDIF